jgi:preprotein translocase subunit SecE
MANPAVETVNTGADKAKWAMAALLVVGGIAAYYFLASQGGLARVGAMLALFAAGIAMFFTSFAGKELIAFGRDAYREVRKVVWPSRKETMQTTAFVFAFVVVMALFLWLTDKTLEYVLYDLILGWRK